MISYLLTIGSRVNVRTDLGGIVELTYRGALPAKNGQLRHFVARSAGLTEIAWSVAVERIAPLGSLPLGMPTPEHRKRIREQLTCDKRAFADRFDRLIGVAKRA